jgi:hypothetical protein
MALLCGQAVSSRLPETIGALAMDNNLAAANSVQNQQKQQKQQKQQIRRFRRRVVRRPRLG